MSSVNVTFEIGLYPHETDDFQFSLSKCTAFVPLTAQGAYQSQFRWALIKTLISRFFSLKLVTFEKKKSMENNLQTLS